MKENRYIPQLLDSESPVGKRYRHRDTRPFLGLIGRSRNGESKRGSVGEPQNPFEKRLRAQEVPLDIPPHYLGTKGLLRRKVIDDLTQLPIEEGKYRKQLVREFSDAIRNDKGWVLFYADADQLKLANSQYGRDFGNMDIRYGAAKPAQIIDGLDLSPEARVYIARQTGAADETVVWMFNVNEDEIRQAREQMRKVDEKKRVSDPDFTFSITTSSISSLDPAIQEKIADTKDFLEGSRNRLAYNFYNEIKQNADDNTRILKIAKDISRLPIEDIGKKQFSDDVIDILVAETSGTRVHDPIQRTCFEFVRQSTISDLFSARVNSERMIAQLSEYYKRTPEDFARLNFTDEDLRVMYFDSILHNIYERLGYGNHD